MSTTYIITGDLGSGKTEFAINLAIEESISINLTNLVPLDLLINSVKLHGKAKYYDLNKLALNKGYTFINDNINICY